MRRERIYWIQLNEVVYKRKKRTRGMPFSISFKGNTFIFILAKIEMNQILLNEIVLNAWIGTYWVWEQIIYGINCVLKDLLLLFKWKPLPLFY